MACSRNLVDSLDAVHKPDGYASILQSLPSRVLTHKNLRLLYAHVHHLYRSIEPKDPIHTRPVATKSLVAGFHGCVQNSICW